jgi:type I restriction enzyme S subunit
MKNNYPTKKLEDVCNFQNGFAFKSSHYSDSGYFVMRITNVQDGYIELNNPKYIKVDESNNFILNKGDILMSLTGNVGRVGVVQESHLPAVLNQRVARINILYQEVLDKKYLFYFLQSPTFFSKVVSGGKGMAQQNVSTKDIKNLEIPLPPLEEQKKIVKVLEEKLGKIDEMIKLRKENIEDTEKLLSARLHEIFPKSDF